MNAREIAERIVREARDIPYWTEEGVEELILLGEELIDELIDELTDGWR